MTQWRTETPIWRSWRHIGRLSGELTIGRVCWDIYTDQRRPTQPFLTVLGPHDSDIKHLRHRAFAIGLGHILIIMRRWA